MNENIGSLKKSRPEHNREKPDFARGNSLDEQKGAFLVRKAGWKKVIKNTSLKAIEREWEGKTLQHHSS